jgi:hypothetical protein
LEVWDQQVLFFDFNRVHFNANTTINNAKSRPNLRSLDFEYRPSSTLLTESGTGSGAKLLLVSIVSQHAYSSGTNDATMCLIWAMFRWEKILFTKIGKIQ